MPASLSENIDVTPDGVLPCRGTLIINADDWGRNRETTDRILACVRRRVVSSTSGMVFMTDSERSAGLAQEHSVDVGLHLNLTTAFDATHCPAELLRHQARLIRYLRRHRLTQALYSSRLAGSFRYVVSAQIQEYRRLFSAEPQRVDGHHHMHLCANVLRDGLLPAGTIARRSFSFQAGDKSRLNLWYRQWVDRKLAQRHRMTDFFFALAPVEPVERLRRIFGLSSGRVLELETHPVNEDEYQFLISGALAAKITDLQIAHGFVLPARRGSSAPEERKGS
jgi:chitin disaccharide deacetylase